MATYILFSSYETDSNVPPSNESEINMQLSRTFVAPFSTGNTPPRNQEHMIKNRQRTEGMMITFLAMQSPNVPASRVGRSLNTRNGWRAHTEKPQNYMWNTCAAHMYVSRLSSPSRARDSTDGSNGFQRPRRSPHNGKQLACKTTLACQTLTPIDHDGGVMLLAVVISAAQA